MVPLNKISIQIEMILKGIIQSIRMFAAKFFYLRKLFLMISFKLKKTPFYNFVTTINMLIAV